MSQEVLATLHASPPRRVLGVGMQAGLGLLLLYIAFATPPALVWQVFLIVVGLGSLWMAQRMWQVTALHLVLTREALCDSEGTVLARIDNIASVERGPFALKPSNGFMIKTIAPQARGWQPGVWWRIGRRVAVGGVTPGSQAKPMADIIAILIKPGESGFDL